jgi:hypothetical protein
VIGQTKEPNTIRSCVIKAKWENVRYYSLMWPLYHIYGVCYVYYFLINIYGIMIISINLDYRKYGIGIMVISINLDYRKYGIG